MRTLRRVIPALLLIGNSIAFANCDTGWGFGATALYVQPSFGGNGLGYSSFSNYGTDIFNNVVEVNGATNHLRNIHPEDDWAFQLELNYTCADIDFIINWSHLNSVTHGTLQQGTLFAGSASALYAGTLNVTPTWDAINLEVGHYIDLCNAFMIRLHAGLELARVQAKFKNYPRLTATGSPIFITTDKITYTGIGPRVGADFNYDLGCGFDVYINAAGSLLAGVAKQSVSGYHDLPAIGAFELYSTGNYLQSNHSVVIPEVESKLGIKYDYQMPHSHLGIDFGYMWLTYLNCLVSQVGSGIVSSAISNSTAASFDLNGFYLSLTWTAA
jgi:hypothetical protein